MDGHVSRLCVGQPHRFAADSVDQLAAVSQRWVLSHLVFGLFCDASDKSQSCNGVIVIYHHEKPLLP